MVFNIHSVGGGDLTNLVHEVDTVYNLSGDGWSDIVSDLPNWAIT